MVKTLIVVLLLLLGVSVGGYFYGLNQNQNKQVIPSSSPTPTAEATNDLVCTNTTLGFSISYPQSWQTTVGKEGSCQFFDPKTNPNPTTHLVTVALSQDQKIWDATKAAAERSDESQLVMSKSSLDVGGKEVQKIEVQATGVNSSPKGTQTVYYFLNDPKLLIVTYLEPLGANTANREVLTTMIKSIKF
jgi:hypothetical protein